ncbi:MAG: CPBP family intramembrane glutamic endopeptidase [Bacteroidia bacterium]|nr:CPBP family intramembrane glutamic endopeptidase [Bacteroidia bacterium]
MENISVRRSILRDLILPILVWAAIIVIFSSVKKLPFEFPEEGKILLRYLTKILTTVFIPLILIRIIYKDEAEFGIYFPPFPDSFKLSFRAYSIGGPAGMSFLLIAFLGWGFDDWYGSAILSITYLLVFYFVPKVCRKLPSRSEITIPNKQIYVYVLLSLLSWIIAFFSYSYFPLISKILYYVFIVGLGEELLFRGYLQSAFNRYFGKPFQVGNVKFGYGLLLASLLFGLIHALVVVPPVWPWALFTFFMGLTLGYIREKDGSILAPLLLHAMLDMPLAFMS